MYTKHIKHGLAHTRQWLVWANMKKRCNYKKAFAYARYGGRGITYDPKWETFVGFWEDMSTGYSPEMTLERIDNNKNYCKENCKWILASLQARNQEKNITIEIQGKSWKLFDLAESSKIKYHTLYNRIFVYGIPAEEAIKHKYMRAGSRKAKDIYKQTSII